jgi:uncharacterized protein YbjT (DUF2867 family)
MSNIVKPRILITGATGQVGGKTIDFISNTSIEIVAAVRTVKSSPFTNKGIETVILDFDDESTHIPAFRNIDRVFIITGYTVDMLPKVKRYWIMPKKQESNT